MSKFICRFHVDCHGHAIVFDPKESVTQQSFQDECDINRIVDRAIKSGIVTHLNARVAQYGDFSSIPDYRTALDQVSRAQAMFMELDAKVREKFSNDPAKFLDFCQNPDNEAQMRELGLLKPLPSVSDVPPLASNPSSVPGDSGGRSKPPAKQKGVGGQGTPAKPAGDE